MNVKNGCANFPKRQLIDKVPHREDHAHMKSTFRSHHGDRVPIYASSHRDIQPMVLVHTSRTTNPGRERVRRVKYTLDGEPVTEYKTLQQPDVFAAYRGQYAGVDVFNKIAHRPRSLQYTV